MERFGGALSPAVEAVGFVRGKWRSGPSAASIWGKRRRVQVRLTTSARSTGERGQDRDNANPVDQLVSASDRMLPSLRSHAENSSNLNSLAVAELELGNCVEAGKAFLQVVETAGAVGLRVRCGPEGIDELCDVAQLGFAQFALH